MLIQKTSFIFFAFNMEVVAINWTVYNLLPKTQGTKKLDCIIALLKIEILIIRETKTFLTCTFVVIFLSKIQIYFHIYSSASLCTI